MYASLYGLFADVTSLIGYFVVWLVFSFKRTSGPGSNLNVFFWERTLVSGSRILKNIFQNVWSSSTACPSDLKNPILYK